MCANTVGSNARIQFDPLYETVMIARSSTTPPSEHLFIDERSQVRNRLDGTGDDLVLERDVLALLRLAHGRWVELGGTGGRAIAVSGASAILSTRRLDRGRLEAVVSPLVFGSFEASCVTTNSLIEPTNGWRADLRERTPRKFAGAPTVEWTKARRRRLGMLDYDRENEMSCRSGLKFGLVTDRPGGNRLDRIRRTWPRVPGGSSCSAASAASARTSTEQGHWERQARGAPAHPSRLGLLRHRRRRTR